MLYIDDNNNVFIKEDGRFTKLKVEVLKNDINLIPTSEILFVDVLENAAPIHFEKLKEMFLTPKKSEVKTEIKE